MNQIYHTIKTDNGVLVLPFLFILSGSTEPDQMLMPWLSGYVNIPKNILTHRHGIPFYQHWGQGYSDIISPNGDSISNIKITPTHVEQFWGWYDSFVKQ